jgi:hypothetical protein
VLCRWRRGELCAEIVAVISNHRDLDRLRSGNDLGLARPRARAPSPRAASFWLWVFSIASVGLRRRVWRSRPSICRVRSARSRIASAASTHVAQWRGAQCRVTR